MTLVSSCIMCCRQWVWTRCTSFVPRLTLLHRSEAIDIHQVWCWQQWDTMVDIHHPFYWKHWNCKYNCDSWVYINSHALCSLSPGHSSERHTATVGSYHHRLQCVSKSNTHHYIWRFSKMGVSPEKVSWWSPEASRNYCDGVWWVEQCIVCSLTHCTHTVH